MKSFRLSLALLVLVFVAARASAADPPPLLAAHGVVEKVGKDTLTVKLRGPDGKFGKDLVLKITGTSKVATLIARMQKGAVVMTQRDTEVKDLQAKQAIAVLYTMVKDSPVLLTAVVHPPAGK
jgi:hypothetical protein